MHKIIISLILGLSLWQGVSAKQSKYYDPQKLLNFNIAKQELTHIAVENDRIIGLKMSNDLLEVEQNDKSGDLFVRVKSEVEDPITLFINTEQGRTIGLRLTPKHIAADSIMIKFKEEALNEELIQGESYTREQQIIQVLKSLEQNTRDVEVVARLPKSIKNLKVVSATQYEYAPLKGQRFVLKNTSKKPMVLEESQFNGSKVLAVALSKVNLDPNENVELYVIKELD